MIVFVLTNEHAYTHRDVPAEAAPTRIVVTSYPWLFATLKLPRATYVFGDLDRLSLWQRRLAAVAYRELRRQGVAVLNNPARVASRYGLLRRLWLAGFNRFNAYRLEEGAAPARWPVFLRTEGDHLGPMSDLLHDRAALEREIERRVAFGIPRASLMVVEFAAEPLRPGLYRKLSVFRVGPTDVAHCCAHEDGWIAKNGKEGIAPPELYEEEMAILRDNPFGPAIAPAFDHAAIEYGRADFGLVGGRPQVYEINDNPTVRFPSTHPSPARVESYRIFKRNYLEALRRIDTADDAGTVEIDAPLLAQFRGG